MLEGKEVVHGSFPVERLLGFLGQQWGDVGEELGIFGGGCRLEMNEGVLGGEDEVARWRPQVRVVA